MNNTTNLTKITMLINNATIQTLTLSMTIKRRRTLNKIMRLLSTAHINHTTNSRNAPSPIHRFTINLKVNNQVIIMNSPRINRINTILIPSTISRLLKHSPLTLNTRRSQNTIQVINTSRIRPFTRRTNNTRRSITLSILSRITRISQPINVKRNTNSRHRQLIKRQTNNSGKTHGCHAHPPTNQ